MSISGGVDCAVKRGQSIGCNIIQIFVKPSRNWSSRKYSSEELSRYKNNKRKASIHTVLAHSSYLLNLGSPNEFLRKRSIRGMIDEMERCELLDIPNLIFHPGSHTGIGEKLGLEQIIRSLNQVLKECKGFQCHPTLEITAGQGTNLGYRFDQIGAILNDIHEHERVGVCFDTEHVFASGYDLRTKELYEATFQEFEEKIGLKKLVAFHINDSKKELGSRVDRHEQIGQGFIGIEPFKWLVNDKRFFGIPMCLETPKGPDLKEDIVNLRLLRSLIRN